MHFQNAFNLFFYQTKRKSIFQKIEIALEIKEMEDNLLVKPVIFINLFCQKIGRRIK